jgi:hypothetical protein
MPNYPDLNTRYLNWKRREKGYRWHRAGKPKIREKSWRIGTCLLLGIVLALLLATAFASERSELALSHVDISIICQIESNNNPLAYNRHSQARGICQITPICLKEYIIYHPSEKIVLESLFCPKTAIKIGVWYVNTRIPQMLRYYGIADTVNNRLWAYNAGIGRVVKGIMPEESRLYIAKYNRLARGK